jgi:6-phosphofructokinase 1
MGVKAVEALVSGQTDVMVALQGRSMELIPLTDVTSKTRSVNPEYFEMAHILSR